jgi:hypothetical protein
MLAAAGLLIAVGCGRSYEDRLQQTLERMKYEKRLNDNLEPAPKKEDGKFHEAQIFVRPPKGLAFSKDGFTLSTLEEGKFDLAASFTGEKGSLHILARKKVPKGAAKKKGQPEAEAVPRGEFIPDVVAVLNPIFSTEVDTSKMKEVTKKGSVGVGNKFKAIPTFEVANGENVQVYFYGAKTDVHQVALIFQYPKADHAKLTSQIELCLESFAVGERAARAYRGGSDEEGAEGGESGSGGAPF